LSDFVKTPPKKTPAGISARLCPKKCDAVDEILKKIKKKKKRVKK